MRTTVIKKDPTHGKDRHENETLGPLAVHSAQHDSLSATDLLDGVQEGGMLLADKAYDSDAIRSLLFSRGAWANIPPRRNRRDLICFSPYLYRDRNLVERFFNRIKHCRRVATRYEKRAANFLAFVNLAAIRHWLHVYESTS